MGKLIPLNNVTRLDLPVERVLEAAKDQLVDAIIIGIDVNGEFYFASNMADGGEVLWWIEQAKKRLLSLGDD